MVTITNKIWQTGSGTYVITVPKAFVRAGMYRNGEEVNMTLEPVKKSNKQNIQ